MMGKLRTMILELTVLVVAVVITGVGWENRRRDRSCGRRCVLCVAMVVVAS